MKTVNELKIEKQLNITRNAHIDTIIKEIQNSCNHVWDKENSSISYFMDVCKICEKEVIT